MSAAGSSWRAWLVDSLVGLVCFTVAASVTERYVAGLSWDQVAAARLAAAPVILLTGRPYAVWRDLVLERCPQIFLKDGPLRHAVLDILAFLSFQVPVYAAILALAGANLEQIVLAVSSAFFLMILLSRPYGLILDAARRLAGTAPSA